MAGERSASYVAEYKVHIIKIFVLFRRRFAAGVLAFLCAACAADLEEIALPFDAPETLSMSGTETLPERWWTAFDDPALNRRIEQALRHNFTLASAWQRLQAARAVAKRAGADLFPDLDATAQGQHRSGDSGFNGEQPQLQLGLEAAYEVDLWGRIRSLTEAAEYRASASLADYRTVALTLSAEIARVWYQRIEAEQQRDLLKEQLEANEKVQKLLELRFGSGLIRSTDILRQRQLVENTREQVIAAELRMQLLTHQLAILQGKPPEAATIPSRAALPSLPPMPRTGLSAALVQRRPDVRSAWLQVQAANQEVAAAISNQYPRITLTASSFTEGEDVSALFNGWIGAVAGSLVAPVLDAGQRAAEVDRTQAVEFQHIHDYGQAVLVAFREVEDALAQENRQRQRLESLRTQVALAEQTYERLLSEYYNGISDYTAVLIALTELQALQRDLLQAERELIEFRIALYRALAGGFPTSRERGKPEEDA